VTGQRGMTVIEVLVVLFILSIAITTVAMNLQPVASPVDTSTNLLEGVFREARLNAIATMSAYRVSPASTTRLQGEKGASCSATSWSVDQSLSTTLPTGVTMSPSSWSVCFSSRGISTANVIVTVAHPTYGSKRVEVLYGGTSRVLP
jgi:prepilin-type N-terminal cleavage/methylation domain-containing protein